METKISQNEKLKEEKKILKKLRKISLISLFLCIIFIVALLFTISLLDKIDPGWKTNLFIFLILETIMMVFSGGTCMITLNQIQNYKLYGEFDFHTDSEDHPGGGL